MSDVEFKKFAICDTCGVETLCREDGEDDQCGGCYWAPINHAKHQSELAALREELAKANGALSIANETIGQFADSLTATEQRNAAVLGKQTKCKECGSDALFWFSSNTNTSGIAEGRLRTNEVICTFVLGCAECSATIKTVRADSIAERMTEAMTKPTESGASE